MSIERKEYKSFYKKVSGGEGDRCNYPTRLDLYGCGCQHDCQYCYAKYLLNFRNLWDSENPRVADIEKVKKTIGKIPDDTCVRLGGMTDCFQPMEKQIRNTYNAIKELNENNKEYLIVTKSHIIADEEYLDVLDKDLAHIQISITTTNDSLSKDYEKASLPSQRISAVEKLSENGFDVQVRLSPYIPEYIDIDIINNIKCDKILVEFLRINSRIKKSFNIDYSDYTLKSGNYLHLTLDKKLEYLSKINNFSQISVCEDVDEHFKYFQENINTNKNDCCNLKRKIV